MFNKEEWKFIHQVSPKGHFASSDQCHKTELREAKNILYLAKFAK